MSEVPAHAVEPSARPSSEGLADGSSRPLVGRRHAASRHAATGVGGRTAGWLDYLLAVVKLQLVAVSLLPAVSVIVLLRLTVYAVRARRAALGVSEAVRVVLS